MAVTNREFAEATGCDDTMASRLRNGKRLPGADLLLRIHEAYQVPLDALHDARTRGRKAMGELLRNSIFDVNP